MKQIFVFFHLLGFAFGLGGATVADYLFFRFLKDLKISEKESEVLGMVSKIIFFGLFVLIISGIGIVSTNPETYLSSVKFLTKMFVVFVITVNGIVLHKVLTPKLIKIAWGKGKKSRLREYRKLSFICGGVSITSWYLAFVLGVLDSIPLELHFSIGIYVLILFAVVILSQILESVWSKYLD